MKRLANIIFLIFVLAITGTLLLAPLVQPQNLPRLGQLEDAIVWRLGRAGGQTISGGTVAAERLTLNSTAHGTKGDVYINDVRAFDAAGTFVGTISGGTSVDAPASAQYVVLSLNGTLTAERLLTEGTAIDLTDAGANSTITVAFDSTELGTATWLDNADRTWTFDIAAAGTNPTIAFASGIVAINGGATLASDPALGVSLCTFGTTGLICEGSVADTNETLLTFTNPTADRTITVPDASLTINAAADLSGATLASGVINSSLANTNAATFTFQPAATDNIAVTPVAAGAGAFTGTITSVDLTAVRSWTFPNAGGTVAVSATAPVALSAAGAISINADGIGPTQIDETLNYTWTGQHTYSSAEILGASPFRFEGVTDNNIYTTFAFTDPTVARTTTFPNATGQVRYVQQDRIFLNTTEGYRVELHECGTPLDPTDDAIPGDALNDATCFQAAIDAVDSSRVGGRLQDVTLHLAPGDWRINTTLTYDGEDSFDQVAFVGDGPSSRLAMQGAAVLNFTDMYTWEVGNFTIIKVAATTQIDHIITMNNVDRGFLHDISIRGGSLAAGVSITDAGGASNANWIYNLVMDDLKATVGTVQGIGIRLRHNTNGSLDNRVDHIIAHPASGIGNGQSMFYVARGSGLSFDVIDSNPNTDMMLLDIEGDVPALGAQFTDRSTFSRFFTAPAIATVQLVRIRDGESLIFSNWVVVGNGSTPTAHIFQVTEANAAGFGCKRCTFTNFTFDDINTSAANDFFNFVDSDGIIFAYNNFNNSNPGGSYIETDAGSTETMVMGNSSSIGSVSTDILLAGTTLAVNGNINMGTNARYQSDVSPFIIGTPEAGVVANPGVAFYHSGPIEGLVLRDVDVGNDIEVFVGTDDGVTDQVIMGATSAHRAVLRANNTDQVTLTTVAGDIRLNTSIAAAGGGKRVVCIDAATGQLFISAGALDCS